MPKRTKFEIVIKARYADGTPYTFTTPLKSRASAAEVRTGIAEWLAAHGRTLEESVIRPAEEPVSIFTGGTEYCIIRGERRERGHGQPNKRSD